MSKLFCLRGHRALVTGASSGLGRHLAKTLAAAGASVGVVARRTDRLESLCREINATGGKSAFAFMDVTEHGAIEPALDSIEEQLGGPVNILLNNAGMSIDGPLLGVEPDAFDTIFGTNARAPFFVAQAVAKRLVAQEQEGSIINIASLITLRVINNIGVYAMSKAAVDQMTRAMAREWARHGIRVNSILPGYIETELNVDFFQSERGAQFIQTLPRRRIGQPEDLDGPVLLLASDAGKGMTGSSILVDDGQIHGRF